MNSNASWNAYDGPLRSSANDIRRVLLHELGHVLGLGHPDAAGQQVNAIMNGRESDTDLAHATWLLSRDVPREDLPRALRAARATAERLVHERWPAITKLAEKLIRARTLTWRAHDG